MATEPTTETKTATKLKLDPPEALNPIAPAEAAGLPKPESQFLVIAPDGEVVARVDLAYPRAHLAIEYDGADHRTQQRARRDLEREAALAAAGWRILRFDAWVVLFAPERIVAEVRAELAAR